MTGLRILSPGPLSTVQDLGRPGYGHLGVPQSGALDRPALRLANRLVGNLERAAAVETTLGGLHVRAQRNALVAVTGPPTQVRLDGRPVGTHVRVPMPAGAMLTIDTPPRGVRNYLAIRGGFAVTPTLGSRATDTLSGLGPPPLVAGEELPIGTPDDSWPAIDWAPPSPIPHDPVVLSARPGPRHARIADLEALTSGDWIVGADSNRIGLRLVRPPGNTRLPGYRSDMAEPASEGVPLGGVQIPPGGEPVIFLADHPVTGGYPVAAVLTAAAVTRCAQLVAGSSVRIIFR